MLIWPCLSLLNLNPLVVMITGPWWQIGEILLDPILIYHLSRPQDKKKLDKAVWCGEMERCVISLWWTEDSWGQTQRAVLPLCDLSWVSVRSVMTVWDMSTSHLHWQNSTRISDQLTAPGLTSPLSGVGRNQTCKLTTYRHRFLSTLHTP